MTLIRLIITDMDGTLLHGDKSMPAGTLELIRELHARGIVFAAGSGRQYASLRESFASCAELMYFIAENGAMSVEGKSARVLDHHPLNIEDVHRFIRMSEQIPGAVPVLCGVKSAWYTTEDPADLRNITPYYHNHQRVSDLHGVDDEILKIAILHHGGTAEHIYPRFAPYRADFSIAVSAFEWMDIMPKGVNKGVGVRMLQKHLGITREETMAFGDFMNDLEMLQETGYSVAMKNALPQIKAVCREETAYTNEEDGVIRWIRQWLKKGIE